MGIKNNQAILMKQATIILLFLLAATPCFSQKEKALYSFCGKSGNSTMTWDEFKSCRKELVTNDKGISINSFILTIQKAEKKDTIQIEYPSKGNAFSKQAIESIEKLHKDKKLGNKILIDAVQVVQSGKEARKVAGMTIYIN
jgi:hypothetical protein